MGRMLSLTAFATALVALAPVAWASDIVVDCPEQEPLPAISYVYADEKLTIGDAEATLSAMTREDPENDMLAIRATGEVEAPMPEPAALDACIDARLKKLGFDTTEEDVAFTSALACSDELKEQHVPTKVNMVVEIVSLEKGEASVYTSRRYVEPSALLGKPIELSDLGMRACTITGP